MTGTIVTGATTPLGARVVELLLERPELGPVLAVAREETPRELPRVDGERLAYVQADLTKTRQVRETMFGPAKELGVDAVIHSAFHRSVKEYGSDAHALNVESTRELLLLAEKHPTITHFVYRSSGDVYRVHPSRPVYLSEDDPLDLTPSAPQRVRDRVEADLVVCARMGLSRLRIQVLRTAEILAADVGSQLWDYLESRVVLRPLGFDPMMNVMTIEDAARALVLARQSQQNGVFNVPGADTLPLSRLIEMWGRREVALPGPLLAPLYRVRASTSGMEFRYDHYHRRFHFSALLDGSRAAHVLGYTPTTHVAWPRRGRAGPAAPSP